MTLQVGVARTRLSPGWGVELAGWGYFLQRTWQRVRDHTAATALVVEQQGKAVGVVAVDLLYADAEFTSWVRALTAAQTGLSPDAICVACSHSHNTPSVALIRGAGEVDPEYKRWSALQTATALILAWRQRQPARWAVGSVEVADLTYNRTREPTQVDKQLTVWRADDLQGRPLAVAVNFQAHPTIMMQLGPADLSRDCPGIVTDALEAALPGALALYLQGACGDVNFHNHFSTPERCHTPGRALAGYALQAWAQAQPVPDPTVGYAKLEVTLPTQRWDRAEVLRDLEEARYRQQTGSTEGWRENLGRVMVNVPERFPDRYAGSLEKAVQALARFGVEWSETMLLDLETRPETLVTEVQALRVGSTSLIANPAELYTSLALATRQGWPKRELLVVGYANASIGYMPDAYDLERRTYAANQSPKFKNQFPFTAKSGQVLVQAMLTALHDAER